MQRLRVLVADDDRSFRSAVALFLSSDASIEIVADVGDAAQAVRLCEALRPDVAILDVRMPGGGPQAARGILEVSPATRILALSGHDDPASIYEMLRSGAIGYALKTDVDTLRDVVRRTAAGRVTVAVGATPQLVEQLARDIVRAERAHAEALERERTAGERLRAVDELKTALLTAVSHELRTPLTTVLGVADTLQRRDEELPSQTRKELLVRLDSQARRLLSLLGDLLDLDRLSRGIIEPSRRPTDVAGLVRLIVEEWEQRLAGRPVTVQVQQFTADIDASLLGRILENLLSNVTRHTPPGTAVRIAAERDDDGVLVTVADAGPGIPDEQAEAVFEPFHHGPSARPHAPGLGVGLSLVARFAELHAGRAWVERAPEGGAAVHVFLASPPADA